MSKIKMVQGKHSSQFYMNLRAGIGANGDLNKNIDESIKISKEGKKKLITEQILASLMGNGGVKGDVK